MIKTRDVILILLIIVLCIITGLIVFELVQQRLDKFELRIDNFKKTSVPAINIYQTDRATVYSGEGDIVIDVGEKDKNNKEGK